MNSSKSKGLNANEPSSDIRTLPKPAFLTLSENRLKKAAEKVEAIRPILFLDNRSRKDIEVVAQNCGKNPRTIYRWMERYQNIGGPEGLLIPASYGGRGKSRLDPKAEAIFREFFQSRYLSEQRLGIRAFYREYCAECYKFGVKEVPSYWSIYRRIKYQDDKVLTKAREGMDAFKDKYQLSGGTFQEAQFPLQTIMIDHTRVDLILRDEITNVEIGRPWLTIAFDAYSRCVWGYYLGFQAPNADFVGMTIGMGCLKKDSIIDNFGLNQWPVYGIPLQIHTDNGMDFRSKLLERGCIANGITLVRRPVKRPQYGSYIERFFGTLNTKLIHTLPGTTFSNVHQKGKYDSQKHSLLTIRDLEKLLLDFIVGQYHNELHRSLGMSPIEMWKEGLAKCAVTPIEPKDIEKFRLDFLCFVDPDGKRFIERDGVHFRGLVYYASELDILSRYDQNKQKKYIVRYDPSDIRNLYVYDDNRDRYYRLLLKGRPKDPVSLHELKAGKRALKKRGIRQPNEDLVMETILRRSEHVESITKRSKKATREAAATRRTQELKGRIMSRETKLLDAKAPAEKPSFYPEAIDVESAKIIRLDRRAT